MDGSQKERFAELLAKKRQRPIDKFQDDTRKYLALILEKYNVPDFIVMEIAGHITVQTYIFTSDQVGIVLRKYENKIKRRLKHGGQHERKWKDEG